MNGEQNFQNESPDTSMTSRSIQQGGTEPFSLPRGSGLSLKTIKMLAERISQADSLADAQELARAIDREATELIKRMEKRAKLQAA